MKSKMALLTAWLSFHALACGPTVQVGLSNAPALGGPTASDARVHDAIANGPDSCGRHLDPGPLHSRIPPCPHMSRPASDPGVRAPAAAAPAHSVVRPWLEHYHSGWPCDALADGSDARGTTLAWSHSPFVTPVCDIP
jgi:hypothetical protein